ncbi:MAG: hypothetical protein JSS27_01615 [Planctomycetes bacterium]|nr:hypothetical protein [Planctomycetota bacterium]
MTHPRRTLEGLVLTLIACLAANVWLAMPCRVTTGSMAPAVLGRHVNYTCPSCGLASAIDADAPPPVGERLWCFNCLRDAEYKDLRVSVGDLLVVKRIGIERRELERWRMVALAMPRRAEQLALKRIVGLPGESVAIEDGDVFIDGQRERKSLAQQRAMAILLYDDARRPADEPATSLRWRPEQEATCWARRDARWEFAASKAKYAAPSQPDWLTYHHARPSRLPAAARVSVPVDDRLAYNQTEHEREPHLVGDVLLTCTIQARGNGRLLIHSTDGSNQFDLAIADDGTTAARRGEIEIPSRPIERLNDGRPHQLAVSLVDQQWLVDIDGAIAVEYPFFRRGGGMLPGRSISLAADGLELSVSGMQMWRDVYYTVPPELENGPYAETAAGVHEPYDLDVDEYFVLGDNSPFSFDSRYGDFGPAVYASTIIGCPSWVCGFESRDVWGRRFQVPAISRIRYIRGYDER